MMMQFERSTRRLSPSVSVALSRIPSSSCQSESDAFSISSNRRIDSFSFSVCHWFSASCVSSGCVSRCPRVSRRRADQLGNLVRVLKTRRNRS